MNIAIFECLPSGGAKRTVLEQVKGLKKRNNKVDLFRIPYGSKDPFNIEKYVDDIYEYQFRKTSVRSGIWNRLEEDFKNFVTLYFLNKKIANFINKSSYDVALIHSDILIQAPYILRFLRIPSIYHCHEPLRIVYEKELAFKEKVNFAKRFYELATRKLRKNIDRSNAQRADLTVTSSLYVKTLVKKYFGREAECCYAGVDTRLFKPLKVKKKNSVIVPGKSNIKGFSFALQIVKKIDLKFRPEISVIGDFALGKTRSDNEIARQYSEALATLCVAHNEPYGLVALESMACGTPVLAVDEGGYRETVVDGVTGYLLPRDSKIFAEKIEFLVKNPGIARRMGKAGREHVKKNFTWDKHVGCIEKILLREAK